MARKAHTIRRSNLPDRKFGNILLRKFINKVMLKGKRTVAEQVVYAALEQASKKLNKTPLEIFQGAIDNVSPMVQLRSRRIGGANYQIPTEVSSDRKVVLAMQWIIAAARMRKGMPMAAKLAVELVDAFNNTGGAVRKKDETHKMAEANRAFAHFARF
ncbi:30S ribosomal protein S7 [candidate division Kazan bacterium RBG_13_50_9]|uniref:Small ribosomal subunit protein uS7 n=1 Tax=candidate division Kazan bacterium RBG_13_50_9 TaxID=1798535 RepID=A0A1F4NSR0_UNCK3|nr:MAG: 30S ribosomal protein S7 [candidate division Kazan bacterium RBG_13_50_9]